MEMIFTIAVLLGCLPFGHSYSRGAPEKACKDMFPVGHHVDSQNLLYAPFSIEFDQTHYSPGSNVTVRIWSSNEKGFKGFFLQARKAACKSSDFGVPIGRFYTEVSDREVQLLSCPLGIHMNNAVTHNNNHTKYGKVFIWNNLAGGDVFFQATFVESKPIFWSGFQSSVLRDANMMTDTMYERCPVRTVGDEHDHVSMSGPLQAGFNSLILSVMLLAILL